MDSWGLLEWVVYILFNIALNIILQALAWRIGYKISNKKTKRRQ